MTDRHFRVEATAAAPPAAVFGHLADIPNWRCWAGPFVPRSELARPGSVEAHGVGALRKLGSPPFWSIEEITGFSPPSLLAYELRSGLPLRGYRSTVTLTPLPSGGTHVGWESTFAAAPPGTGRLFAASMRWIVAGFARRLCAHADRVRVVASRDDQGPSGG